MDFFKHIEKRSFCRKEEFLPFKKLTVYYPVKKTLKLGKDGEKMELISKFLKHKAII